jgi:hypothetical protein
MIPNREYCDDPYEILTVIEKIYSDMNLSEWTNAGGSKFYFRALVAVPYDTVDGIAKLMVNWIFLKDLRVNKLLIPSFESSL